MMMMHTRLIISAIGLCGAAANAAETIVDNGVGSTDGHDRADNCTTVKKTGASR